VPTPVALTFCPIQPHGTLFAFLQSPYHSPIPILFSHILPSSPTSPYIHHITNHFPYIPFNWYYFCFPAIPMPLPLPFTSPVLGTPFAFLQLPCHPILSYISLFVPYLPTIPHNLFSSPTHWHDPCIPTIFVPPTSTYLPSPNDATPISMSAKDAFDRGYRDYMKDKPCLVKKTVRGLYRWQSGGDPMNEHMIQQLEPTPEQWADSYLEGYAKAYQDHPFGT